MSPLHIVDLGPPEAAAILRCGMTGSLGDGSESGLFYLRTDPLLSYDPATSLDRVAAAVPELDLYVFQRQPDGFWLLVEYEDGQEIDRYIGFDLESFYDPDDEDSPLSTLAAARVLMSWH